MDKIKGQLAGVAALLGVIAAIGGGFVKYGEITTKLKVLESKKSTNYSTQIAVLEEKVNKTLDESIEYKKSNDDLTRDKVISEMSSDLADTEIEKFKGLTEDVDFGNEEDFKGKLETLKESYFPKVKKETTENIDNVETGPAQDIDITDSMAAYSKAIGTAVKGATK